MDGKTGVPEVGVRAGRLPDREELRRRADEGEPGHRGLGADGGGEAAHQQDPPEEDQPGPPLRLRARALQVPRGALGRRDISQRPFCLQASCAMHDDGPRGAELPVITSHKEWLVRAQ